MKTGTDSVRERPPWRPAFGSALGRNADDTEAFRDFYVANVQRVVVFFTRRTLNAEIALDLTGETFAVALQRRRQFRGRTDAEAEAWLFAIARSQLSHFWRRGVAERRALEQVGLEPPCVAHAELERIEELAGLPELRRRMQRAMAGLHPQQAYAVVQRIVAEREYDDVSRGLRALAATRGLSAAA
jgi:RNA polymerase sigma-70 factor, ECF subfamily